MENTKIFSKNLKIVKNNLELELIIEAKEQLSVKAKHYLNPLLEWVYSGTFEQIMKAFPILHGCDNLSDLAEFLSDQIEYDEYSIKENDVGLELTVDAKLFKKKIKINLVLNEVKDPKSMLLEMSKLFMKLGASLPKNLYENSEILRDEEFNTIRVWIDPMKKIKLTLLYQGSRDTFAAAVFHQKCNGKSPTLTLGKSHLKFRFGGFTSIAWDSSGAYKKDANAFLFSLTYKKKFKENGANSNSIYGHQPYGPTFGATHDLYFADNCAINYTSYSNLGNSYSKEGIDNISEKCILAGNYNFLVKALEVYQVDYI